MIIANDNRIERCRKQLKPCPFCGDTNNLDIVYSDTEKEIAVECHYCHYRLPIDIDLTSTPSNDIVDRWNNRG